MCASVLRTLPPAAPPASPVAPALASARGMIGRVLYTAASFLCLLYTIDFQPTGKVEGVGAEVLCRRRQRYKFMSVVERPQQRYGHRLELAENINLPKYR